MRKAVMPFLLLILAPFVQAHVSYVVGEETMAQRSGADVAFLLKPLSDPFYVFLMIATAVIAVFLYFLLSKNSFVSGKVAEIVDRAVHYIPMTSWMLRLSLGILLIGAGTAGVLLSPSVAVTGYGTVQIFLGFLLLSGFLTMYAVLGTIALYLMAVLHTTYALGNLELLAACFSLLILANPEPGLDHLLGFKMVPFLDKKFVPLILRIGIGCAFIYLAVYEKILNPHWSEAVVTQYNLMNVIPVTPQMWVLAAGLIEFAVGLMLLLGLLTRLFATIAFLVISMSFFYFSEAVYSHITLFGVLSVLVVLGGGAYSVDSWWADRKAAK